jgi:hypothetical protein
MADYTTTSSTQMPAFVQPYAQGYLQRAQTVADSPYQQYPGQRVADLKPYQPEAAGGMYARGMQGNPTMAAGNTNLQQTLGGQYLQGNPYLQSQIDQAQGDAVRSWNTMAKPQWDTAMQRSGSFGNSGLAQMEQQAASDTQRNIGQIGSNMRFQNYDAERSRQMQAAGMAPTYANQDYTDLNAMLTAGQGLQQQQQKYLDNAYNQFTESRDYGKSQLDVMRNALGGVNFGSNTTQTQPGASTASTLLGGGLTGAAIYNMLFK